MTTLLLLFLACARSAPGGSGPDPDTSADTDTAADTDTDPDAPMIGDALADLCGAYTPGSAEVAGDALWKVTLDDPDALCNDGTPAVMYVRPSTGGVHTNRWLIYLQGGAACSDLASCVERYCGTGKYTKAKMSSTWTNPSMGESALTERDGENPFGEANQVVVHYCSSDFWTGTKSDTVLTDEESYPGQAVRLHFRGRDIVRAAVEKLLAGPVTADENDVTVPSLADAELLVFAGSSAGGRGAEHNLDWVAAQVPDAEVYGWFDAYMPPTYDDMGADGPTVAEYDETVRWPEIYEARYGMWLEESCAAWHPAEERWLCGNAEHLVLHHVTTPFFVRQDLRDAVVGERYLSAGVSASALATVWADTLDRVHEVPATAEEADAMTRAPGVYAPNCGQHVGLNDAAWLYESVVRDDDPDETPYTHRSAFAAWFAGAPVEVLDTEPRSRSVCAVTNDDGG